jgi:predicted GNAT superfamily acetyltransferase
LERPQKSAAKAKEAMNWPHAKAATFEIGHLGVSSRVYVDDFAVLHGHELHTT